MNHKRIKKWQIFFISLALKKLLPHEGKTVQSKLLAFVGSKITQIVNRKNYLKFI